MPFTTWLQEEASNLQGVRPLSAYFSPQNRLRPISAPSLFSRHCEHKELGGVGGKKHSPYLCEFSHELPPDFESLLDYPCPSIPVPQHQPPLSPPIPAVNDFLWHTSVLINLSMFAFTNTRRTAHVPADLLY